MVVDGGALLFVGYPAVCDERRADAMELLKDALEVLANGHGVISEESARALCAVVGVPFPEEEVFVWESRGDASERYGFYPFEEGPGHGVNTLDLSYHVARALGLGAPGVAYSGRGYQARANAQAIAKLLGCC